MFKAASMTLRRSQASSPGSAGSPGSSKVSRLLGVLGGLFLAASVASAQTTIKVIPAPADVAAPPADAKKTASGLASKVTEPGTGKTHPASTDLVTVHYTGWTTDGKMFDSSVARGKPATFPLDRVIAGWTEGVQLMVHGETRRFWIPEALAYKGTARAERHAGVRRRADLVHRIADPGAGRREGPARQTRRRRRADWRTKSSSRASARGIRGRAPRSPCTIQAGPPTASCSTARSCEASPTTFPLDGVIPGWTEGVQLMVEGEKTRFWIPQQLAYKGQSPPYGMLVFDVELIKIN